MPLAGTQPSAGAATRGGISAALDRRFPSWCASALHGDVKQGTELLNNPLYVGQHIWNRSRYQKDPDTKRSKRIVRDRSEWIVMPAPHLRIISDELWERVKARQREVHLQSAGIRAALQASARTGRGPKYLFSGLLVCGVCGSKFVIVYPLRYGCSGWLYRGQSVCTNTIKVSRTLIETHLLASVQRDLFTEEGLACSNRRQPGC
jgi:site-specific DNA recombinase